MTRNDHSISLPSSSSSSSLPHLQQEVFLCCGISLKEWPRSVQVGVEIAGVLFFFLLFFVLEEELFKGNDFNFPGVLTLCQSLAFSLFAFVENALIFKQQRKAPLSLHAAIGFFASFGTMASLNALTYLNFPTWVLFKSSRILSVMIGGLFILGKKHTTRDFLGAFLIVTGLVLFTLGDMDVQPSFNYWGVFLVTISLVLNSLEGNYQERILREIGVTQNELMMYSNAFGVAYLFPLLLITHELQDSFVYFQMRPNVFATLLIMLTVCALGMVFVIALLKTTDAVVTVTVTSLRKAFTVILSFVLFSKPWSWKYLYGGIAIAAGGGLEVLEAKARSKKVVQ